MADEKKKIEFGIYKDGKEVYRTELNEMEQAAFTMAASLMIDGEKQSPFTLVQYVNGKENGRKQVSEKVVDVFKRIHTYDWNSKKTVNFDVYDKDTEEK